MRPQTWVHPCQQGGGRCCARSVLTIIHHHQEIVTTHCANWININTWYFLFTSHLVLLFRTRWPSNLHCYYTNTNIIYHQGNQKDSFYHVILIASQGSSVKDLPWKFSYLVPDTEYRIKVVGQGVRFFPPGLVGMLLWHWVRYNQRHSRDKRPPSHSSIWNGKHSYKVVAQSLGNIFTSWWNDQKWDVRCWNCFSLSNWTFTDLKYCKDFIVECRLQHIIES